MCFSHISNRYFDRPYWRCYFPNTQAVIYVVDSSDTDRIGVAKEEFHAILEVNYCPRLPLPILLYCFPDGLLASKINMKQTFFWWHILVAIKKFNIDSIISNCFIMQQSLQQSVPLPLAAFNSCLLSTVFYRKMN